MFPRVFDLVEMSLVEQIRNIQLRNALFFVYCLDSPAASLRRGTVLHDEMQLAA